MTAGFHFITAWILDILSISGGSLKAIGQYTHQKSRKARVGMGGRIYENDGRMNA